MTGQHLPTGAIADISQTGVRACPESSQSAGAGVTENHLQCRIDFLNHMLRSIPYPFYVIDIKTHQVIIASLSTGTMTDGLATCHALLDRTGRPCLYPEHPCPLEIVLRTRQPVTVIRSKPGGDGQIRAFEISAFPVFADDGEMVQVVETSIEVTERIQIQEQLLQTQRDLENANRLLGDSQAKLLEAQHIAGMCRWELEISRNSLTWYPDIADLFELAPGQTLSTYGEFLNRVHPDDRLPLYQAYRTSQVSREPVEYNFRVWLPAGRIKWMK